MSEPVRHKARRRRRAHPAPATPPARSGAAAGPSNAEDTVQAAVATGPVLGWPGWGEPAGTRGARVVWRALGSLAPELVGQIGAFLPLCDRVAVALAGGDADPERGRALGEALGVGGCAFVDLEAKGRPKPSVDHQMAHPVWATAPLDQVQHLVVAVGVRTADRAPCRELGALYPALRSLLVVASDHCTDTAGATLPPLEHPGGLAGLCEVVVRLDAAPLNMDTWVRGLVAAPTETGDGDGDGDRDTSPPSGAPAARLWHEVTTAFSAGQLAGMTRFVAPRSSDRVATASVFAALDLGCADFAFSPARAPPQAPSPLRRLRVRRARVAAENGRLCPSLEGVLAGLETLELDAVGPGGDPASVLAQAPRLRRLSFYAAAAPEPEARAVPGDLCSASLQSLQLGYVRLLRGTADMPLLEHLRLRACAVQDMAALLRGCPRLRTLVLEDTPARLWSVLRAAPRLASLVVSAPGCLVSLSPPPGAQAPALRHLRLDVAGLADTDLTLGGACLPCLGWLELPRQLCGPLRHLHLELPELRQLSSVRSLPDGRRPAALVSVALRAPRLCRLDARPLAETQHLELASAQLAQLDLSPLSRLATLRPELPGLQDVAWCLRAPAAPMVQSWLGRLTRSPDDSGPALVRALAGLLARLAHGVRLALDAGRPVSPGEALGIHHAALELCQAARVAGLCGGSGPADAAFAETAAALQTPPPDPDPDPDHLARLDTLVDAVGALLFAARRPPPADARRPPKRRRLETPSPSSPGLAASSQLSSPCSSVAGSPLPASQ